jgi:hypothetical protein
MFANMHCGDAWVRLAGCVVVGYGAWYRTIAGVAVAITLRNVELGTLDSRVSISISQHGNYYSGSVLTRHVILPMADGSVETHRLSQGDLEAVLMDSGDEPEGRALAGLLFL